MIPAGSDSFFVSGNAAEPDPTDSDLGRTSAVTLGVGEDDLSWDAGLTQSVALPEVITTTTNPPAETLPFTRGSGVAGVGVALLASGR